MIVPAQAVRVVIATRPIDFRRGHDSLAAYVQNELKLDPHSGALIVFRSRRGDRIKVLVWDGSGWFSSTNAWKKASSPDRRSGTGLCG